MIPPGHGLPWGTPEEEFIPKPLVFEAEFALAKARLKMQTPAVVVTDAELAFPPSDSGDGDALPAPHADMDADSNLDTRPSMDGDNEMIEGTEETIEDDAEDDIEEDVEFDADAEELLPMAYEEEVPRELRSGSNVI